MNVTHDILVVQDEHSKQKKLLRRKPNGQQLITNWLGQEWKQEEANSDNSTRPTCTDDNVDGPEHAWVPPLNQRIWEELWQELNQASSPDTIMVTQGHKNKKSQAATEYSRQR